MAAVTGTIFQVPLQAAPQVFPINIAGNSYTFTLQYRNTPMGGWILDIGDANDVPFLQGIPLVTGANLLAQFSYINFGFGLFVSTLSDADAVPTFTNLGTDGNLYVCIPGLQ
jgi:hypothetical protein